MQNNDSIFIGLTGGIGSGKSTVTKYLLTKGYKVIDADVLSRQVVEKNKKAYHEIIIRFGKDLLTVDGEINRKKLGEIVFNDKVKLNDLNAIVHPRIREAVMDQYLKYAKSEKIIFADVPLLIESNLMHQFDAVWLVYAPVEQCIERIIKRDFISVEMAKKIIDAQMPIELKKSFSDVVISNTEDLEKLYTQIDCALEYIISAKN